MIVTYLRFEINFFPFMYIPWGPIIPTNSLFHDISSATLSGTLANMTMNNFLPGVLSNYGTVIFLTNR